MIISSTETGSDTPTLPLIHCVEFKVSTFSGIELASTAFGKRSFSFYSSSNDILNHWHCKLPRTLSLGMEDRRNLIGSRLEYSMAHGDSLIRQCELIRERDAMG